MRLGRVLAGVVGMLAVLAALSASFGSSDHASTCFGVPSNGALRDAWRLPRRGKNFRAYSDLGWLARRTFVHSEVHAVVLEAYQRLETAAPDHEFVYGESAFPSGGRIRPHRTHQNGLSVDFLVPVRDSAGAARQLSTGVTAKLGYAHEFDERGRLGDLQIDFEAMSAHLAALRRAALAHHAAIRTVIFDPKLRARLAATRAWPEIAALPFSPKPPWIRHDEHYHVDFELPCKPLSAR